MIRTDKQLDTLDKHLAIMLVDSGGRGVVENWRSVERFDERFGERFGEWEMRLVAN